MTKEIWYSQQYIKPFLPIAVVPILSITRKTVEVSIKKTDSQILHSGQQRMRWLSNISNSTDMNLSKLQETVEDRGAWNAAAHGVTKSQTQLSD